MLAAGRAPLPVGSAGSESVQRAPVSRTRHAPASARAGIASSSPWRPGTGSPPPRGALARVADPGLDALAPAAPPRAAPAIAVALSPDGCAIALAPFRWLLFSCCVAPSLCSIRPCSDASPACIRLDADPRATAPVEPATKARAAISAKPGFRRALPRVLRGCRGRRMGSSRATAPRRLSAASPSGSEDVRGFPGACPLGGAWGAQPRARCGFRGFSGFPAEARRHPEPAQARWKPGGRGAGPGLPGSARVDPRSRARRRGWGRGGRPLAAAPSASESAAMRRTRERAQLLMWCPSRALPALTTIMSMPSKRTGTSPSGCSLQPSGCQQLELLAGEVSSLKPPLRGWPR